MSKQQLAAILEMSAQNPIPANATPAVMPVAENVQIERVNCGPCDSDLILPAGGDASRLIIFYHGGGFFFGSSRTACRPLLCMWGLGKGCATIRSRSLNA
jgi:acetyl esterase/lipase